VNVSSIPSGMVAGLAVLEDRENRPLKILFAPIGVGDTVTFRVETFTLLRDRPLADGKGVAIANAAKVPKNVELHLKSAPGIDVDAPAVKKAAAALARKDFASLMMSLSERLRDDLEYSDVSGLGQGAKDCLASGKAVCTGFANTAAAILIAAKVPTRILACTQLSSRLQEHYIVEAWGGELGWSRMESTMKRFPYPDSDNLVLRIVYPDAKRSRGNVPLYSDASGNLDCSFNLGADKCWQGGEQLATATIDAADVAAIEAAVRERFERLVKTPEQGAKLLLFDPTLASSLGENGRAALERAHQWLDSH
jgi:hypothetical protein